MDRKRHRSCEVLRTGSIGFLHLLQKVRSAHLHGTGPALTALQTALFPAKRQVETHCRLGPLASRLSSAAAARSMQRSMCRTGLRTLRLLLRTGCGVEEVTPYHLLSCRLECQTLCLTFRSGVRDVNLSLGRSSMMPCAPATRKVP